MLPYWQILYIQNYDYVLISIFIIFYCYLSIFYIIILKFYIKMDHTMFDFLNDKHARMHALMHTAMLGLMHTV